MAIRRLHRRGAGFDGECPVVNSFTADSCFEVIAKRVVANDADDKRRLRIGERVGWPFDELGEIEQERGLYLILGWRSLLCATAACCQQQAMN